MEIQSLIESVLDFLFFSLPFFITIYLGISLFNLWVSYIRKSFFEKQEKVLLRIYPPKEIYKTPAAMELVINSLYQPRGDDDFLEKYWEGSLRAEFSLEIVSHGGEVAFYIWTNKDYAKMIENQIYAQYPNIEIEQVSDYSRKINYNPETFSMFGLEYKLTDADPIPIKTYIDYGLDKSSENPGEYYIDPLATTLESLGSIKPGENIWLQIIIRAHKKEDKKSGTWFGKTDNWAEDAKKTIEKIREESILKTGETSFSFPMPTKNQQDKIATIERSLSKPGFDCGIRGIYVADKNIFEKSTIATLIGAFQQYGSPDLNGFKPGFKTKFDYKWQEKLFANKLEKLREQIFNDYQKRIYFRSTINKQRRKKFILNSEELATIFHFPSSAVSTPTLKRIQSKKSEAPANLPIQ